MDKDLLIKYIKGLASHSERELVLEWIEERSENAELFNRLKADWTIEHLPYTESETDVVRKIRNCTHPENKYFRIITRVAAFMLIPVVLFSVYQHYNYSKKGSSLKADNTSEILIPQQKGMTVDYTVNPGVKGLVVLPDGSKVWLNSDSYLKCPGEFDSTFRSVELCGEGYFSIVSDKDWPMFVKTSKGITVKVTGTEFNICSYSNDNELRFTLVSGEVKLIRESTKQVFSINVNQEITIPDNINQKGRRATADIYANTAWKEGHLIFENTPMEEVIKKIQRWYGVKINVGNPGILKYSFTADFYSESITQVLEFLRITSNITYSLNGNKVKLFL